MKEKEEINAQDERALRRRMRWIWRRYKNI
jgi:hypothetical protein